MDLGISGKVALVTGASQGIGFGIARELAQEGARVAISSRTKEKIEAAAAEIGARGYVHDTVDLDAAPGLIDGVTSDLGPSRSSSRTPAGRPAATRSSSPASSGRRRTASSSWRRSR